MILGTKHSKNSKSKMSLAKKGNHYPNLALAKTGVKQSKETIEKRASKLRGRQLSLEQRKKLSASKIGIKFSEEHRKNIGESVIKQFLDGRRNQYGEKNPNWKGGISEVKYLKSEFSERLKNKIRKRDNYTCRLCGKTEKKELAEINRPLCVHHIDFNKLNNNESNLNTLCLRCNIMVNKEREFWSNYFMTINFLGHPRKRFINLLVEPATPITD